MSCPRRLAELSLCSSLSFLRTTPAKNPRTECGSQPVQVMIVAMVVGMLGAEDISIVDASI